MLETFNNLILLFEHLILTLLFVTSTIVAKLAICQQQKIPHSAIFEYPDGEKGEYKVTCQLAAQKELS